MTRALDFSHAIKDTGISDDKRVMMWHYEYGDMPGLYLAVKLGPKFSDTTLNRTEVRQLVALLQDWLRLTKEDA